MAIGNGKEMTTGTMIMTTGMTIITQANRTQTNGTKMSMIGRKTHGKQMSGKTHGMLKIGRRIHITKNMNTTWISRQTTTAANWHKSNHSTPKGAASGMSSVTFYCCKEGTFWDCQSQRSANALPKRKFSSYFSQQNIFTRFSAFTILILEEDRWSRDTRHSCRDPSDF